MLLWIAGMEISAESLSEIPDEFIVDFIILTCLMKNFSLRKFEAESILQTIVDVKHGRVKDDIEYPETISAEALRASFLYSKIFFVFHACLGSVGIKQYLVSLVLFVAGLFYFEILFGSFMSLQGEFQFDNVHFQKLYAATETNVPSEKDKELYESFKVIVNAEN